jgi:tetratricopeptide repeat protein 4
VTAPTHFSTMSSEPEIIEIETPAAASTPQPVPAPAPAAASASGSASASGTSTSGDEPERDWFDDMADAFVANGKNDKKFMSEEEVQQIIDALPMVADAMPEGDDIPDEFAALQALIAEVTPMERATEFKKSGNTAYKLGPNRYEDAVLYYTQALDVKCEDDIMNASILANRSLVHLKLHNYGKAMRDAMDAIRLIPHHVKAHFRAASACLGLKMFDTARKVIIDAMGISSISDSEKESFRKLAAEIDDKEAVAKRQEEERKKASAERQTKLTRLEKALDLRDIRMRSSVEEAQSFYRAKLYLDDKDKLHWSVLFLYPQHMTTDFIEDMHEETCLQDHINVMFPPACDAAPWDDKKEYTVDNVQAYLQIGDAGNHIVRVSHTKPLRQILQHSLYDYAVPSFPVITILPKSGPYASHFMKSFNV